LTSNSKIALLLLAALLAPALVFADQSVMRRGDLTVARQSAVDDVVVADGDLTVQGTVRGSVFVVNGDALLSPGASVAGNLTVLSGSLSVARGAAVDGEINVLSGQAHVEDGARVGGEVHAVEEVSSLTPEKLAFISRYILFDRRTPPDTFTLSGLDRLDPPGLRPVRRRGMKVFELGLFELGHMPLDRDAVDDSWQMDYRGRDKWLRVAVVRFKTADGAAGFWSGLREKFEGRTTYSVHNSLGEGGHWFFRHREATYCLWFSGRTLQAVMVRQFKDDPGPGQWKEAEAVRDQVVAALKSLYNGSDN
jgi:cytoskeletal protein CcmA (bactofilin family)